MTQKRCIKSRAFDIRYFPQLSNKFDDPAFPDHMYLDLARVFQFILNALGDRAGKIAGLHIGHLFWRDENADLAAGLDGVRLLNPSEGVGNGLEVAEAL